MRVDVLTLFPEMFGPVLDASILGIAQDKGLVEFHVRDLRDFGEGKRRSVDDKPYGGGPGMVMMPEPVFRAVEAAEAEAAGAARRILLSPQGEKFSQPRARELAAEKRLLFICGRYEGFDERVRIGLNALELSIGDYVLSGGELAAMVVIDAVVRLVPSVLGCEDSLKEESFSEGLLEYPQYTRPALFRGMRVPEVLLSGDHARVAEWRRQEAVRRTREKRPDLLKESDEGIVP
jgi:tRNA (guanine37-N1)-methyltransferase